jgi:BON domain-containing protein
MARRITGGTGNRLVVPASVGVIGLALIGLGQTIPNRHAIQDDLTSRSTEALKSADLVGLSVSFSGRDATITGSGNAGEADQAEDVVSTVEGVRVARAELGGAGTTPAESPAPTETASATTAPTQTSTAAAPAETPTEAPAPKPAALPVGFTLVDGTITVTGTVGSKAAGTALIFAVKAAGNGWTVVDRLVVDDALTVAEPKPSRLPAVTRLLAAAPIDGTKLVIQYNRGSVILRGTPASAAAERALLTSAARTVANKSAVVDGLDTAGPG